MYVNHRLLRTKFLPLFCSGVFLWLAAFKAGHGTVSLFGRLMKDSRYSMKKAGRSADTTTRFFQAQE